MNRDKYRDYMLSPAWQKKRERVRQRSGGKCELCGERSAVDVHHRTYARVGKERLSDLIHLCRLCHEDQHDSWQPIGAVSQSFVHTTLPRRMARHPWKARKLAKPTKRLILWAYRIRVLTFERTDALFERWPWLRGT